MSRLLELVATLGGSLQGRGLRLRSSVRERACAFIALMQTRPVLAGTLLVACGYSLMRLGWQDTAEATLVYCLGAYLLASFCRHNGRALWLFRAWNLAFVIDLGVKAFLITVYKSRPDAAQVIEGISNTNSDESAEFLMNYWMLLGTYTLQLSVLAVLLIIATRPVPGLPSSGRKGLVAVGLVFVLLHLNPAVRRANPLVFWPAQAATVEEFHANLDTLRDKREIALASLSDWQPTYAGPADHTLGLVIGESTNRWNWQIYGYERATTPELQKLAGERAGDLMVFRDVLSAASSTVSALRHMLTPLSLHEQKLSDEKQPSVLMLAKAAGYKVFWISNQHDRYVTARFAEEADVVRLLNTGGVGDDRSLDERVLPEWKRALADPAPRKLIVAHLMGAHAHYDLRCPEHFKHFESHEDEVDRGLEALGRPPWVRLKRDQYDDAMLYQDWVISHLLTQFKDAAGTDSAAWLYTSDHGEEVGHTRDFTGHSPDEPGQVVPLLIWNSKTVDSTTVRAIERRPFQTDVLDWTLLDLMHLHTRHDQPQDLLLGPSFHPRKRRLHDGSEYQASGSTPNKLALNATR